MAQIVKGFHGTTLANATAIVSGSFNPSKSPDEWLGTGIYFFEAAPSMAWAWAKRAVREQEKKTGKSHSPAIISADIDLDGCLDLFDFQWSKLVEDTAQRLSQSNTLETQHGLRLISAAGLQFIVGDVDVPPTEFRKNKADCQVLNAIWGSMNAHNDAPKCVRAPFNFGRQTHTNSFFFSQTHVQIAVIDASILSNLTIEH